MGKPVRIEINAFVDDDLEDSEIIDDLESSLSHLMSIENVEMYDEE